MLSYEQHPSYQQTSFAISKLVTKQYSTSFYFATQLLPRKLRQHVFSIYGFVRCADEIVDTFHSYDKKELLHEFERELYKALERRISLNPVLHAFQETVHRYSIPQEYIEAFLKSMRADLDKKTYFDQKEIEEYIYGSADVVGLMCLKIFCDNDEDLFNRLKDKAQKLGSAFQKVNFLRDLREDREELKRTYFVELTSGEFDEQKKLVIINDIENDFITAYEGIRQLPRNSKWAVYVAYLYYTNLLKKIRKIPAHQLMKRRVRISNLRKGWLIVRAKFEIDIGLI